MINPLLLCNELHTCQGVSTLRVFQVEYMCAHVMSKVIQVMRSPFLPNDYLNVNDNPSVLKILTVNFVLVATIALLCEMRTFLIHPGL